MVDENNPAEDVVVATTDPISPDDAVESPIVKTYTEWLTPEEIASRKRDAEIAELMIIDEERLEM